MNQRKGKRAAPDPAGEFWGLDPQDVRAHARRMRESKTVGPLSKFFRFAAVALLLVAAFAVYWNFDTLRQLRFDFSQVTAAFEDAAEKVADASRGGEPRTEVVGDSSIAGVSMPTSIKGDEAEAPVAEAPADRATATPPATEPAPATAPPTTAAPPSASTVAPPASAAASPAATEQPNVAAAREEPPPSPPPAPAEPPKPEQFGFGLEIMKVSEAAAAARVLVLRDGGTRGVSFITWWTTNGTAMAGSDFARLEPRTERFAVGEQNRTLLVPIIGDRVVEGPENFFVHIAVGQSADAKPVAEIEVLIEDDD